MLNSSYFSEKEHIHETCQTCQTCQIPFESICMFRFLRLAAVSRSVMSLGHLAFSDVEDSDEDGKVGKSADKRKKYI